MEFTLDEIQEQLSALGYTRVPRDLLFEFKKDLDKLLQEEGITKKKKKNSNENQYNNEEVEEIDEDDDEEREYRYENHKEDEEDSQLEENDEINTIRPKEDNSWSAVEIEYSSECSSITSMSSRERVISPPRRHQTKNTKSLLSTTSTSQRVNGINTFIQPQPVTQATVVHRKIATSNGIVSRNEKKTTWLDSLRSSSSNNQNQLFDKSENPRHLTSTTTTTTSSRPNVVGGINSDRRARFQTNPVDAICNYTAELSSTGALGTSRPTSVIRQSRDLCTSIERARRLTGGLIKSDPVQRYHQYQRAWKSMGKEPACGEHKQLRWAVKAAMLVHEVPTSSASSSSATATRRIASARSSTSGAAPPPDNRRDQLRWQIRQSLAANSDY